MALVGIDLGTTNSLISTFIDEKCKLIPNAFGDFLTPSVVGLDENDNIIVGKIAKERLITDAKRTASSFKQYMGTEHEFHLGSKSFSATELSSFVLRQLKEDAEKFLGEEVTEAVISVPAYFDDNGRNATKLAGELAGLKVERIINEPSSAALAYRTNEEEEKTFLVFDFGGGTLDVSVVDAFENVIEILAVSGDNHLGGDEFNMLIAKYFCEKHGLKYFLLSPETKAIITKQSEMCKIGLSTANQCAMFAKVDGKDYSMILDNQTLLTISAPLFLKVENVIKRALSDAMMNVDEVDDIILVGGSSQMAVVRQFLKHILGKELKSKLSPDTVVAVGAGIASGIKSRDESIKDLVLTDICPFTLGVDVLNKNDANNPLFSPIIERNSTLPITRARGYCTVADYQENVTINIYQGENMYCNENTFLGRLNITVPKNLAQRESIEVKFTYDINGILQVSAKCLSTGETVNKLIINKNIKMSEKELDEKIKELKKYSLLPKEKEENIAIIEKANELFTKVYGENRDIIQNLSGTFDYYLANGNERIIRKYRNYFENMLNSIEESLNGKGFIDFYNFDEFGED